MGFLEENRQVENENGEVSKQKVKVMIGKCPYCSTKLNVDEDGAVECPCCGKKVYSYELANLSNGVDMGVDLQTQALIADVRSMESVEDAVIFFNNYFDNYDWASYLENTLIYIPEVEEALKSIKIKSGSKAIVWTLDFDAVAIPLGKRIGALIEAEKKMEELYSETDNTDLMEVFDAYQSGVNAILSNKDAIIKRLELAIDYAEKLGLAKTKVATKKQELASLETAIRTFNKVEDISDVAALNRAKQSFDFKLSEKFANQGINAEEVYAEAVASFNEGRTGYRKALDLFNSIKGYGDSRKYINKIDKYFVFNREVIFISGKPFVLKEKFIQNPLNVSAKGKDNKVTEGEDEGFEGKTYELFPIYNEQPASQPAVTGMTDLISYYATDIYYIKKGKEICCYNTETCEENVIDGQNISNYVFDKKWYNLNQDKLYICKKLDLVKEKLGCLKKLFGKKAGFIAHANNYSLVELNLSTGEIRKVVEELVDVYQFNSTNLFYTFAEEKEVASATAKHGKEKIVVSKLRCVNIETGVSKDVLGEDCDIHKIVGSKVVYSYHTPNEWNKELHVYDLADDSDVLIEENVYDFVNVIKGKVFYKVGNANYSPLFSNNFDGTDRVQITEKLGRILQIRGSWIYVVLGGGKNKLLRKISHDGKKVIDLCSSFEKIIKLTDAYIYYLNCWGELCSVRFDGKQEKVIADNIDANNVIVERDAFYYLRNEAISSDKKAFSLYTMDAEGKNIKKLAFDIKKMQNYDDEKLYISREERAYFEVTIPEVKGKSHIEKISTILKKVVEYNKLTGKFTTIRTIGMPSTTEYEFKTGCFGKTEKVQTTIKRVPGPLTYCRSTEEAGSVYEEQVAKAQRAKK